MATAVTVAVVVTVAAARGPTLQPVLAPALAATAATRATDTGDYYFICYQLFLAASPAWTCIYLSH